MLSRDASGVRHFGQADGGRTMDSPRDPVDHDIEKGADASPKDPAGNNSEGVHDLGGRPFRGEQTAG